MKKRLSLLLALVCLLALAAPAAAAQETELPLIYIEGVGADLYRDDGTKIYDLHVDLVSRIMERMPTMMRYEMLGEVTGDFSRFNDTLCDAVVPAYEDIRLGNDGLPRDGSHIHPGATWKEPYTPAHIRTSIPLATGERAPVYRWHYDWRLSPVLLAEELNELVKAVKAETGAEKVDLIARCYGTNIAYAYLYQYGVDDVNACMFYTSSLYGVGMLEALFTGEVTIDHDTLVRYADYYKDYKGFTLRDEATTELLLSALALMNDTGTLGFTLKNVLRTVNKLKSDLFPRVLRDTYASFPSYWSMIGPDAYPAARAFLFGGVEDEWAGLLAQTDAYYEMQKNMDAFLSSVSDKVRFGAVAKYGFPAWPLSEDAVLESDVYSTTHRLSLGAETARLDGVLSDETLRRAVEAGNGKYLSADRKINAGTALFPDTTWFVKDLAHSGFPNCVNDLMVDFLHTDGMTVETDAAYTQFLQYHDTTPEDVTVADGMTGTLTPIRTMADTHDTAAELRHSVWQTFGRFFRAIGGAVRQLFSRG